MDPTQTNSTTDSPPDNQSASREAATDYDHSATMRKLWLDPQWRAKQKIHREEHAARMSRLWENPEWADRVRGNMKAAQAKKSVRARIRDAQLDAARKRAKETGVAPFWTPKQVAVLEPTGTWFTYPSIKSCAEHYGMKDSHLRAVLKHGRTWHGMKFVTRESK